MKKLESYYQITVCAWPERDQEVFDFYASNSTGKEKRGRCSTFADAEFRARAWCCK